MLCFSDLVIFDFAAWPENSSEDIKIDLDPHTSWSGSKFPVNAIKS